MTTENKSSPVSESSTEEDKELQKILDGIDPRQLGAWRSFESAPVVIDKPTDSYEDSTVLQKKLAVTERELLAHHQMLKGLVRYLPPSVHLGYGGKDFYPDGNVSDMGRLVQNSLNEHKSMKEAFDFLWERIGTRLDKGVGSTNYRLIAVATVALVNRLTHELNQSISGEAFLVKQREGYQELEQQTAERHLAQCQEIIASKEAMALKLQEAEEKLARLTNVEGNQP